MTVVLPHTFRDGVHEVASGVQVDDNFNALKAAVEALQTAQAGFAAELNGLVIRVGIGGVVWGGNTAIATVAHGLGRVPTFASATATSFGSNIYALINELGIDSMDATNFVYRWGGLPGGPTIPDGGITSFRWIAVG